MFILCLYEDNFICIKIGKSIRLINMKAMLLLGVVLSLVFYCNCQSSSLIVNVIEQPRSENITFVCTVSSLHSVTRWTHRNVSGSTRTSFMILQNGICTVLPSGSFLTDDNRYAYTCNSTMYQVTILDNIQYYSINNHMFACGDALQPDRTGSTWIIKYLTENGTCSYCEPTITFDVMEVNEGDSIAFVCRVSSDVSYVNWNINFGPNTAAMGILDGQCTTSPSTSFLDNTSESIYTCNKTVYQVRRLNVQRSQHNDMYLCTPALQMAGKWANWIIKVKAPVSSVTISPANSQVNVTEYTPVEFTCTTSTSRPAASVYWYIHPNGNSNYRTQITENITTTTDYDDLSVIKSTLRFFFTRLHNNVKIFCTANNSINTSPVRSNKILLNVLYKADDPYIPQGNEYRVIENTSVTLSCSVKGGNPTPALSWSCRNFSPTNQATINSNGNITSTLTWNVLRNHDGQCACTSQQTGYRNETIDVSLVVLYPPSKPVLKVNGRNVHGSISFIEGKNRSIECTSNSKPLPDRYAWTGSKLHDSVYTQTVTFNTIEKNDAGQYKCSVHNTMNPSYGSYIAGINTIGVNVVVLYPPVVTRINNISILQGEKFSVSCPYTPGIPIDTSIKWTRNIDDKQWYGEQLLLSSIKKSDAGYYSCDASNVMKPSGDDTSYIGNRSQRFYLDVLYEAVVLSLLINGSQDEVLTVDEGSTIKFKCVADGNPTPAMTLSHDLNALMTNASRQLEYTILNVSCQDIGTYRCTAQNIFNLYMNVTSTDIIVQCSPRLSKPSDMVILSGIGMKLKIACEVTAYPLPSFTWWHYVNDQCQWKIIQNTEDVSIKSSGLQTILTLDEIDADDFTRYKVIVENSVGNMEQLYSVNDGSPDSPTQLRYFEELSTSSWVKLAWNAEYNGGSAKLFYIKYKTTDEKTWKYKTVIDDGEQIQIYTLNGLEDKMYYYVTVLASNEYGNSTASALLITKTKDNVVSQEYGMEETQTSNIGPMVGGIVGGSIVSAVIFTIVGYIIGRYMERKRNLKKSSSSDKFEREDDIPNLTSTDIQFDNIGRENEYEMINQNNSPSMSYSTLQLNDNMTADDTNGEKKEEYENLKVQAM